MANQNSNKTTYWILGLIIILIIIGFAGYKLRHRFAGVIQYTNTSTTTQNAPNIQPQGSGNTGSNGLANKFNTSNQQLDQDLLNIQNSLNQLQQDQNTANQDSANQSQDIPQQ